MPEARVNGKQTIARFPWPHFAYWYAGGSMYLDVFEVQFQQVLVYNDG